MKNILIINPQHKEFIIKLLKPYFNIFVATDKPFPQYHLLDDPYKQLLRYKTLDRQKIDIIKSTYRIKHTLALNDVDVQKFVEIQTFDNKIHMNMFLTEVKLKTLPCILYNGQEDLNLSLPFIYKPVESTGRIGFRVVERKEDIALIPIGSLIQPKLTGPEYNLDILIDKGKCITVVAKEKLAINAGTTSVCKLVDIPELSKIGKKLCEFFQITTGSIDVDVMEHKGEYYVIDINSRIGGGFPHSCNLCPKFYKAFVDLLLGRKVKSFKPKINNKISIKESNFIII